MKLTRSICNFSFNSKKWSSKKKKDFHDYLKKSFALLKGKKERRNSYQCTIFLLCSIQNKQQLYLLTE